MNHKQHREDLKQYRRHRLENISILAVTVILFIVALNGRMYDRIFEVLNFADVSQDNNLAVAAAQSRQKAELLGSGHYDFDAILMFGFFASLGLSIFAVLQYGRLKVALQRQREAERNSRRLALMDPLTGLPNRRNFEDFAESALQSRQANEQRAIFLVDLDQFKPVNDVYGHAAGDKVLSDFARRVERSFPGGMVARFGGDEFAAITPPIHDEQDAISYAQNFLTAVEQAFSYKDVSLSVGASVGASMLGDADDTVAEAMRRADIALYQAKRNGRRQIAMYEPRLEVEIREKNWIERELRQAIQDGDVVPYFQPIVDLTTHDVIGYEALARWRHKTRGMISPAEFITIAEETGLIQQVCEAILSRAVALARFWPANIMVSVNLSPVQLRDRDLAGKLLVILRQHEFPPSRLEVEITENALTSDLETAKTTIEILRAAGVSVALDDFGTGASTLNHLRICQFDKIKIDQSFVQSMAKNHDSLAIITAILGLSRNFNLRCTAEGIENASDLELLTGWGCAEGQGYFFGRPAESTAFDLPAMPAMQFGTSS